MEVLRHRGHVSFIAFVSSARNDNLRPDSFAITLDTTNSSGAFLLATCAYCSTTIIFGGKKQDDLRFCNAECQENGILSHVASQIPRHEVDSYVAEVHRGSCPRCMGAGPVDVHTSYRVFSALVITSWSSRPAICCRRCGTKRKLGDAAFSALLGWWGLPWGLFVTPMQIGKNLFGFFRTPDPRIPSSALETLLRLDLAAQLMQEHEGQESGA